MREIAPGFPNFRRPGSVPRSQLIVTPKLFGTYGFGPAFPVLRCEIRCKSFLVPSAAARLPECCVSLISDSLASLVSDSLAGLISVALPSSVAGSLLCLGSILIRSSFPVAPADYASGSPGVPFPDLLRVPLPVLRWLVSSLSFWRIAPPLIQKILAIHANAIGPEPYIFVEISHFLWKRKLTAGASSDTTHQPLWITSAVWLARLQGGSAVVCDSFGSNEVGSCPRARPHSRRRC